MNYQEILQRLETLADPDNIAGMAYYGITPTQTYGVKIPELRNLAKEAGKNHKLAQELWSLNNRETRILASIIEIPEQVTEEQMESWVNAFDYWEICDQCCMNLFEKTPYAYAKAVEWSEREEEFVKRAGFVLMARLAVSDKKAADSQFNTFLPIIERESYDPRNFVKKAVNWALRQIGKRNLQLNNRAIETAEAIRNQDNKSAKWIAQDALRELTSEAVRSRLRHKSKDSR